MPQPIQRRIRIPGGQWTPFGNEMFRERLGKLDNDNAAALYVVMYDRAYHHSSPTLEATVRRLSRWSGLKQSDVKTCLRELRKAKLLKLEGKSDSDRTASKPRWAVPLAVQFKMKGGKWFPIPRFLIRKYIPAYQDSVLLLPLLQYQHLHWQNNSYPKLATLCERVGWMHTRVSSAIGTMSDSDQWSKLRTGLPRPLTSERLPFRNGMTNYFHVRAVRYESDAGKSVVRLPKFFERKFGK
jgi:hypothetical protein